MLYAWVNSLNLLSLNSSEPACARDAKDKVPHTQNPFTIMMAMQRQQKSLPHKYEVKKPNRKLDLKNDILGCLEINELGWTADAVTDQGCNFINTLADVLWAIDGHDKTLQDRGCGIPEMFKHLQGYNKPEITKHRKRVYNALLRLADNLRKYANYLDEQLAATETSQARKIPRTDVDEWQ
ncbi:Hypothetical predicted protein, partial [Paramuricea clavata]